MIDKPEVIVSCESAVPTPWAVHCGETFGVGKPPCNSGQLVYLTAEAYEAQMSNPDARWKCPWCGGSAEWSDDNFESWLESEGAGS